MADGLAGYPVVLHNETDTSQVPVVSLTLSGGRHTAQSLVAALEKATPSIHADPFAMDRDVITLNPMCLKPGEADVVAASIKALLG